MSRNWKCGGDWTPESPLGGSSSTGLSTGKDPLYGTGMDGNIRHVSAMQIANQPKQEDLTDPGAGTLGVPPKPGCLKGFRMSADFDDPLEGFDDGLLIQNTKPGTIMTLSIQLPDHAAALLRNVWDDLPRAALESLAVEGYRSGRLSCAEVGELLGHSSRWESEEFLAAHGVWPGTTVEELESDLATLNRLRKA